MSKRLQSLLVLALTVLLLPACDSSVLDQDPHDTLSPGTFWETEEDVQLALTGAYASMYPNYLGYTMAAWDAMADNAYAVHSQLGERNAVVGGITSTTGGIVTDFYGSAYNAINTFNSFLANAEQAEVDAAQLDRASAEVRFLRALYYYYLSELYGGVPVVTEPYEMGDELVPRGTKGDVVDQITSDLDFAIEHLPDRAYDGHAVRASAQALKVRVLMANDRMEEAATLAGSIIDSGQFCLYPNYKDLFEVEGEDSCEILFSVEYQSPDNEQSYFGWIPGTGTYQAWWSSVVPLQDFVDAYEMTDGQPIDASPLYDPDNPYENRDPRLAATVYYPGSVFGFEGENGGEPMIWGEDYFGQGYITPYNLKKFVDPEVTTSVSSANHGENNYHLLRYAEVLLNYAEAQNETAGPDASVYEAVDAVRERAGMPALPSNLSQDEMRERIRNERRVELAFESGLRFLDLKRWNLAGEKIDGLQATENTTYRFDNDLWPIPQSEIDYYDSHGASMEQNPGY